MSFRVLRRSIGRAPLQTAHRCNAHPPPMDGHPGCHSQAARPRPTRGSRRSRERPDPVKHRLGNRLAPAATRLARAPTARTAQLAHQPATMCPRTDRARLRHRGARHAATLAAASARHASGQPDRAGRSSKRPPLRTTDGCTSIHPPPGIPLPRRAWSEPGDEVPLRLPPHRPLPAQCSRDGHDTRQPAIATLSDK